MASRLQCKACGRANSFGDKQPMRKFCDDECERVYGWLHGSAKGKGPKKGEDVVEAEELDPRGKKALARCKGLVAIAVNHATFEGERQAAALNVCKILARYELLEIVEHASERFTPEDLVRWAEKVGRERARGRSW
jgi:endogenous inhibitor of DNA gyrase (YacG/DUF329 family)